MKPSSLIACFLAAFGVYLIVNGLFAAAFGIYGLGLLTRHLDAEMRSLFILQYSASLLPLIAGVVVLVRARHLGAACIRWAGATDTAECSLQVNARELAGLLFAATGMYLLITNGAECARLILVFLASSAATPAVAEHLTRGITDNTSIIVHIISAIAGLLLIRKSRRLSAALGF